MALNDTVSVPAVTWTQLTNGDVTEITFQNLGPVYVLIKATVGANAPANTDCALAYQVWQGERKAALADLFPGVSGANRVYAYALKAASVAVSHA